jgi:protein-tyrosine phosphatase
MIDIHCHILPGIDDGPSDMAESIEMARIAAGDGITTIVATPHLRDGADMADIIASGAADLNRYLDELAIPVKILLGADINVMLSIPSLKDYTINGTRYLLYEFPHTHMPGNAGVIIFNAMSVGLHPIITHPERNPSVIKDPNIIIDLRETGPLVQITAGSLTGYFGPGSKECALYLLKKGAVDIIATDAHSCEGRRPVLSEGLHVAEKILGRKKAALLVQANPLAVIEGRRIRG